jgi:hypothetical protein
MNRVTIGRLARLAAIGASGTAAVALSAVGAAASPPAHRGLDHRNGARRGASAPAATTLRQRVFASSGTLTGPDDITRLGGRIFVVWQNATKPDGSGGVSTVVAYRNNGKQSGSWEIPGHIDGLTADPANHRVIATANEDSNSSLYTITPHGEKSAQLQHYTYSPDPSTLTGGGTDAISIVGGKILISASNPQNTLGPAVFQAQVPLGGTVATLTPYFNDNSSATDATTGGTVTLALTDPDSNTVVPRKAPTFGGDFVLDSQGDSQLIFAADNGTSVPSLTVLNLNAGLVSTQGPQVDDVRWTTSPYGTLFVADAAANKIYAITGSFGPSAVLTAIPGDSPSLAGDIGRIDLVTGTVTAIVTGFQSPKGLLYLPGHAEHATMSHGHRNQH